MISHIQYLYKALAGSSAMVTRAVIENGQAPDWWSLRDEVWQVMKVVSWFRTETRDEVRSGHCSPKRPLEFWPCCVAMATSLALTRSMTSASYAAQRGLMTALLEVEMASLFCCFRMSSTSRSFRWLPKSSQYHRPMELWFEAILVGKPKEAILEFKRKNTYDGKHGEGRNKTVIFLAESNQLYNRQWALRAQVKQVPAKTKEHCQPIAGL